MASRSYRVRIAPSNKVSFSPGETVYLDLPSNLSGTFMDMSQTYIRMKVRFTNASTGVQSVCLDKPGAYGFLQRVACITSGQQIFDLNNYNVLVGAFMDTDASNDWKANAGNVLAGTTAATPHGETFEIPSASYIDRTYCLPFILNPFALQKKLVPLFSLDSLRWRITLETSSNAFIPFGVGTIASMAYSVQEIELVSYFTELSPSAMAQLDSITGGVYNLLCPSYSNTQTTMAQGTTTLNSVLGIAVSSLERILVIHRPDAANVSAGSTLGARITNGLQTAQFFINSEAYPQRNILIEDMAAEPLAEFLIADHALSDFSRASNLQNMNTSVGANIVANVYDALLYNTINRDRDNGGGVNGINNAWGNVSGTGLVQCIKNDDITSTVGSFVLAIELETGCSAGRSDRLYSGISTISSVVQYKGTYSSSIAATLDFFAQFTVLLTLNMRQTGVWSITI